MEGFIATWFPHGYCLAWNPYLIGLNLFGDVMTFTSYCALAYLIISAKISGNVQLLIDDANAWMWAGFIWSCGMTHLFGIFTVWQPIYFMETFFILSTGLISAITAYEGIMEAHRIKRAGEQPNG